MLAAAPLHKCAIWPDVSGGSASDLGKLGCQGTAELRWSEACLMQCCTHFGPCLWQYQVCDIQHYYRGMSHSSCMSTETNLPPHYTLAL